uniref:Uncharacterized protein n=1 Tax=Solanum tuberosum TaxID=4113 RepID=M1BA90_SOLTU
MTLGFGVPCSIQFHPFDGFQLYSTSPPSAESMKREPCSDSEDNLIAVPGDLDNV